MSHKLLIKVWNCIESKISSLVLTELERHHWIVFSCYVTISYVVSLHGPEGLLLDLKGLHRHWDSSSSCVVITLLGKIKGELFSVNHLIPCKSITSSGINVK